MVIENGMADGIDFFRMDALSSAVAMKGNCVLQLTLMAGSLYKLLARQLGEGYGKAKFRHILRGFVDATVVVDIQERGIAVHFQKRAHNPLLPAAELNRTATRIRWRGNRRLSLVFG